MIHLMLKYIPYRISLNKVIIISNQATDKYVFKKYCEIVSIRKMLYLDHKTSVYNFAQQ